MHFHLLLLVFFVFPAAAQENDYQHLLNRWVTINGQDQWSFDEDGMVVAYYNGMLTYFDISGDTLFIGKTEEYEETEEENQEDEYSYEEGNQEEEYEELYVYVPEKDDARFRICKLTSEELVLHPLNEAAVKLIDETPMTFSGNVREKIYKDYLNEVTQAKDQEARATVIAAWKEGKHELYVDTIRFFAREALYEHVEFDSLYYSSVTLGSDKFYFRDLKLLPDGTFIMHKHSAKRIDKRSPEMETVRFIPPVVKNSGEMEEEEKPSVQDILLEKYQAAGDGWYKGQVSQETMMDLLEGTYYMGLSRIKTEPLEEFSYYLNLPTHLMHFRFYVNGTYKDIETYNMNSLINMDKFLESFNWLPASLTEFGPYKGRPVEFPMPFPKK